MSEQGGRIQSIIKHQLYFYTPVMNNSFKNEIRKTIPFIVAAKRIKLLRINLIKEWQHMDREKYKTLLKEIKEIHVNEKAYCVNGLENLILLRW